LDSSGSGYGSGAGFLRTRNLMSVFCKSRETPEEELCSLIN